MKSIIISWLASIGIHITAISGIGIYSEFSSFPEIPNEKYQITIESQLDSPYKEPICYTTFIISKPHNEEQLPSEEMPVPDFKEVITTLTENIDLPKEDRLRLEKRVLKIENMSKKEKEATLEKYLIEAEKYPKENLQDANQYLKDKVGIKQRVYEPINEVKSLTNFDSAIPYFKTFKKKMDGEEIEYIQKLLVDEEGNYIAQNPKIFSQMTPEEKSEYRLFSLTNQNPWLKEMRNTALGAIIKILESKNK